MRGARATVTSPISRPNGAGVAILSDVGSRRTGERTSLVRRQSALVLTVLGVIVVSGTSVWASPAPIGAPWDVFVLLDGAYRMSLGQVPGTDFGNPVGPMVYGLTSVGMKWQGQPSLASVAYGNLV